MMSAMGPSVSPVGASAEPLRSLPATPLVQLRTAAATIETDMRNLCAEARRKNPDLQDSAERAMVKLRTVATGGQPVPSVPGAPIKQPIDVLQSDSVLRPLLLACSSRQPKLCTLALASIQRLVSLTPLSPRFLATVMGTLRIQAESEDQSVQLKVLQTLLLTISPAAVECGELLRGSLLQALSICFRLYLQKKSAPIHHTAFAALRQLVALLFERVSWQSQQGLMWQQTSQQQQLAAATAAVNSEAGVIIPPTPSSLLPSPLDQLSHEAQNAFLLFQDLCILSANGPSVAPTSDSAAQFNGMGAAAASSLRPRWLTTLLSSSIPAEVCIELLENIVDGSAALFRAQPVFFSNLVQRDLCALLLRLLRSHFDFPIVLRLVRCVLVLVKAFHASLVGEVELFLSLFIRMTHASFPLWHRVLVLEACLQILRQNHDKFAYWLFHTYDLTPAQRAEAVAIAQATATLSSTTNVASGVNPSSVLSEAGAVAAAEAPQPNPNQTRIFTSLLHALSRLVIQTGTALCGDVNGANGAPSTPNSLVAGSGGLSGGGSLSLAVGTGQGFSSASSALLTASAPSPSVVVTVPTTPATAAASLAQFPLSSSANGREKASSGLFGPQEITLAWKLYTSKGNRGLDLLNLEQEMGGAGSTGGGGGGSSSGGMGGGSSGNTGAGGSGGQALTAASMYEEAYVITLGIEILVCVVNGLAALAKTNEKWGGSHQKEPPPALSTSAVNLNLPSSSSSLPLDASSLPVDPTILRFMATASCMPILGALSFLLARTAEEAQIQHLLMAYQSFTNTAGVLELTRARDQFLLNLCAFALPHNGLPRDDPPSELIKSIFPPNFNTTLASSNAVESREFALNLQRLLLSPKNIQSLKALFNISHCLGAFLGSASWLLVLETFQSLDTMIQLSTEVHFRLARAGGATSSSLGSAGAADHAAALQELYNSLLPHQTEINIMAAALSRLFESTRYLDDKAVTHVLSALGTLSLSALANAATSDGADSRSAVGSASLPLPGVAGVLSHAAHPAGVGPSGVSAPAPQTIRMFALVNLIATLEHNLFRLTTARLWDIGVGHLTCVINHKDALIRSYGVAALTKIAILALNKPTTYLLPQSPPPVVAASSNTGSGRKSSTPQLASELPPSEYASRIQRALLEPFADLFRSKYEDTRENILMSLFQILQSGGQGLGKGGWGVVMNILQAVVQGQGGAGATQETNGSESEHGVTVVSPDGSSNVVASGGPASSNGSSGRVSDRTPVVPASSPSASASFIHVGFNSVQLITNDFLETVPFSALSALIDVVRAYCAQIADTNISFTSIGLLWRISDFIAKQGSGTARASNTSDPSAVGAPVTESMDGLVASNISPSSPSNVTSPAEVLSDALADSLMQQVFTSLVSLSVDSRTEVRNSAVKTLHNTLVAHAARMSLSTCVHVLHTLVLPLLSRLLLEKTLEDNVRNQQLNSTELGKDKTTGKSVMMLIHYSRDTASKQWDETRVFALQGTARVLKGYIDTWARSLAASSDQQQPDSASDAFVQEWLHYLQLNLVALSNRSPEVTLAALNAVMDLVTLIFSQQQHNMGSGGLYHSASNSSLSSQLAAGGPASASSTLVPSAALQLLWTPVLERFYIRGVSHALVQHRHVEWVEEQERRIEEERKERKAAGVPAVTATVDFSTSPFVTSFGELNAEEGWKSWLKTYTHLLGNLHTLLPLLRRVVDTQQDPVDPSKRDDVTSLLNLSHMLVRIHASYTEQRARAIFAQRKQNSGGGTFAGTHEPELSMIDRKETPLQAAHLKLLESLCSTPVSTGDNGNSSSSLTLALWSTVFDQLLSYLLSDYSGATDIAQTEAQLVALASGSPVRFNEDNQVHQSINRSSPLQFASTSFAKKVLRLLDRLYVSVAPASVRAEQLSPVLSVLSLVLASGSAFLRDGGYQELCEEAVAALIHILEVGLQSVNERIEEMQQRHASAVHQEQLRLRNVWASLVSIFASFLAPPSVISALSGALDFSASFSPALFDHPRAVLLPPRPTAAQQRVWENLQIALVGCLVRIVLPQVAHAPAEGHTLAALVSFLNVGFDSSSEEDISAAAAVPASANDDTGAASLAPATHELLSHSCLMALFLLSRAGTPTATPASRFSSHDRVAALAAPLLLRRCHSVLESYLALERLHAPSVPLPRCRREEMGFVLRELCTLELHPTVAAALPRGSSAAVPAGKRAHLLALIPVLCQCITMRESELRELLRGVFQHAAVELGLQQAADTQAP